MKVRGLTLGVDMQKEQGFLDSVRAKIEGWAGGISIDSAKAVEILSYAGVAFLAGFLFKRFFRTAFIVTLSFLGTLFLLTYLGFISVDWVKVQTLTGVHSTDTIAGLGAAVSIWVRENVLVSMGAFVGFIVGYSIG
jgi:uncharacterized membrane protein (Fun14 family)